MQIDFSDLHLHFETYVDLQFSFLLIGIVLFIILCNPSTAPECRIPDTYRSSLSF